MKRITLIFSILCIFSSCEKIFDHKEDNKKIQLLIVEGMITNELKAQSVKLSYPASNLNEEFEPATNAVVIISSGNKIYTFREDTLIPGTYLSTSDFQGVVGKTYNLYIRLNGVEYTASTHMVPVEALEPFQYVSCDQGYQAIYADTGDPAVTELQMDWSGTSACNSSSTCKARTLHYKLNNIDVNSLFKPDQESICFPAGTIIIRKKYSLTPEYQEFLRTLLSETEWRGGLFDVESGNVSSNLSSGAAGYFSASTVVKDTIIIK